MGIRSSRPKIDWLVRGILNIERQLTCAKGKLIFVSLGFTYFVSTVRY